MVAAKVWNGSSWEYVGGAITASVQPGAPAGPAVGQLWLDTDELAAGQGNGPYVCTSSTRPTSPPIGMQIFETDTGRLYIYTGTAWRYQSGGTDPTAVRAYASASQTAAAGWNIVTLNTKSYDYGNNFATGTYTYTCPRDGLLHASGSVSFNTAAGDRFVLSIWINGAESFRGTDMATGPTNGGPHVSSEMPVVSGDQVTLRVWSATAGKTTVASAALTFMTCRMIP